MEGPSRINKGKGQLGPDIENYLCNWIGHQLKKGKEVRRKDVLEEAVKKAHSKGI